MKPSFKQEHHLRNYNISKTSEKMNIDLAWNMSTKHETLGMLSPLSNHTELF